MPEDRVTITADASQYFDVLSRAGVAADRLGSSGARAGQGFVRGERVIRTASANIAASLLASGDAATTALVAMQGLERVFRIGILPTVAVAAGVAIFEVFHKQIERTKAAHEDLRKEIELPLEPDTDKFSQRIDTLRDKMKKLKDENESFISKFMQFMGRGTPGGLGRDTAFGGPAFRPEVRAKTQIEKDLADSSTKINILADARARGILAAADKLHQALEGAVAKFRNSTGNVFRDIGSGQFAKDLQQRNSENLQTGHGQEVAAMVEEKVRQGLPLNELEAAIGNAARGAAAKGGVGVEDILNADFSNLDTLSKYDFSGLAPLAGLTLIVK